jgi:hypothetical protein
MAESQTFEIDLALLEFAQRYANTSLKRDIVALFAENPHVSDEAGAIARRLARAQAPVARELEDLRLLGLLRRMALPLGAAYRLTDDPDMRAALLHFREHFRQSTSAAPRAAKPLSRLQ